MKLRYLIFLLLASCVSAAPPPVSLRNLQYDANGNVLPTQVNGHNLNLPTNTTVGGLPFGGGGGNGSLTDFIFQNANGIIGTVMNHNTTPTLSLALGAITPTSVNGIAISGTGSLSVGGAASISGINTGDQVNVAGNAGTATKLQVARNINGVAFDGTTDITVRAAGSTLTDTVPISKGGTGLTALGTALQVLRVNAGGTGLEFATLSGGGGGDMLAANNLSELTDKPTARTNLGVAIGSNVEAWDQDLDYYAGFTPAADVKSILQSANFAAIRVQLGLVIGVNVQAFSSSLTIYSGITPSANMQTFLGSADFATMRSNMGVAIGSNVQAFNTNLQAIAGLTSGANLLPYFTGSGTAATTTLSTFARTFLDDLDAPTVRNTIGATGGIWPVAAGGTGTATPSLVAGTGIGVSGSWPNQTVAIGSTVVTAASNYGTDNVLIRSDGTSKGTQRSGVTLDDSNNLSGFNNITTSTFNTTSMKIADSVDGSNGLSIKASADMVADKDFNIATLDTVTLTFTGPTSITMPTSGTVATTSNIPSPPTGTGFYHVTSGVMDVASVAEIGTGSVVRATAFSGTGNVVRSTAPTIGSLAFGAGSATAGSWPKLSTGTLLTTPEAGAIEYGSTNGSLYFTPDGTTGRGQVPVVHRFFLSADGSAIGPTADNFFGSNSAVSLVASGRYFLRAHLVFSKATAGTVQWAIKNQNGYTNLTGSILANNAGGIGSNGTTQGVYLASATAAAGTFPQTASLTDATKHIHEMFATIEMGSGGLIEIQAAESAGTITPLEGSFFEITKLSTSNVGTFTTNF